MSGYIFIIQLLNTIIGDGMESLTASKEYQEGVKKVGPGSIFYYRSIFDPVPSSELKDPKKYGMGAKTDAC